MRKTIPAILLLLLVGCNQAVPAPAPALPLAIDGFFADWEAIGPLAVDPAGDGGPSGVDFTSLVAVHTKDDLVFFVDLGRVVNLQSEPALVLTLSAGGPELVYDLAARAGSAGGSPVGHADIGLVSLPTVTSDRFEIAIRRDARVGGQALFAPGAPVTIALADPNPGGDTVEAARYTWSNPAVEPGPAPVDRPPGALRLVSYNVDRDGLHDSRRADRFGRILAALQPDIIAFQEVYNRSAASVEERVESWLGGDWHARKQADLVTVSRFPFVESWTDSFRPLDERIYAQMVQVGEFPLLVFNAHFFCCAEDEGRQEQADGFIAFLRDRVPPGTPFVLLGDLNLVGDAAQLNTLLSGDIRGEAAYGPDHSPDWDGTALADLLPRHVASAHVYTWWDPGSEFAPGRLDYVLYSDSLLAAAGFVFDPVGLTAEVLGALGVEADDARRAGDHLPLVVDVRLEE